MKKIISLFQRNYKTDKLVRASVVPGAEWVLAGEGIPTEKIDGTCCMIRGGRFYKRYDRKINKKARRRGPPYSEDNCRPAPENWEAAEEAANQFTGHWPGWLPVIATNPEDKWHISAMNAMNAIALEDGTYELVGSKIQGNPYGYADGFHILRRHGDKILHGATTLRTFDQIKAYLESRLDIEGIVWHHLDGRMVKIKRRDFGLEWPTNSWDFLRSRYQIPDYNGVVEWLDQRVVPHSVDPRDRNLLLEDTDASAYQMGMRDGAEHERKK